LYCNGGLAIGISCFLDFLVQGSDLSLVFLVPFQFCKIIISTYCFLSVGYLAYYAADKIQKMSLWQERGLRLDIMLVDPLAANLYVF
jgi:hypothetical protein